MKNKIRSAMLLSFLALCLVGTSGCFLLLGAAAGAGGYAWVRGAVVKEYNVPAENLNSAVVKGLNNLDIGILEEESDRLSGKVVGSFADGEKVYINVDALTEKRAKVSVRVGVMGDRIKSDMIINAIQNYL